MSAYPFVVVVCKVAPLVTAADEASQLSTQLSYVGTMYLMLMKASSPPCCSNNSSVC